MFSAWSKPGCLEKIYIMSHGAIAWDDDCELWPDALYLELPGESFDELPVEIDTIVHGA